MNEEGVKIHIYATNQDTTAIWRLEGVGIAINTGWVCILGDIKGLKMFSQCSKVRIEFNDGRRKEAVFYYHSCDRLVQIDSNALDFWTRKDNKESEDKSMLHNVTVTKTEEKVLEEYWTIKAIRNLIPPTNVLHVTKEYKKEPILEDIAQFLSDTNAKSATVEHNYRFEPDLPFC